MTKTPDENERRRSVVYPLYPPSSHHPSIPNLPRLHQHPSIFPCYPLAVTGDCLSMPLPKTQAGKGGRCMSSPLGNTSQPIPSSPPPHLLNPFLHLLHSPLALDSTSSRQRSTPRSPLPYGPGRASPTLHAPIHTPRNADAIANRPKVHRWQSAPKAT